MTYSAAKSLWPIIIVALIVLFLGLTFWSIRKANQGVSAVTNDKYYSHGLRYNETQIEKEAAEALGWAMDTRLEGSTLKIQLTDAQGVGVEDVLCTLTIYPGKSDPIREQLAPISPGRFDYDLPSSLSGQITIQLQANREGAGLSRTLLVNR